VSPASNEPRLPTVSVLVPCYNGLPFALECVQSVVDQITEGVECIVVDDGSTDGSADALEARFGARIRLERQANAGAGAARNRCLELATGELIMWLDADDLLAPESLQTRRAAFARDASLEMLVVQFEVFDTDTGEREIFPQPPCDERYVTESLLLRKNLPHLDCLTFRRSALDKIGRFGGLLVGEDWELWMKAWVRLRWSFMPVVLAFQRQGSHSSITHRLGKLHFYREQSVMLKKCRPLVRELLGSDAPWQQAYAYYAADHSLVLLLRGYRRQAFFWGVRALVGSNRATKARGFKYACEALSPGAYAWAVAIYRKLAVRPGHRPLAGRD
jgi:glycosyltransferase involved in cell wall biosynthesis